MSGPGVEHESAAADNAARTSEPVGVASAPYVASVLALQRSAGNHAVALLARSLAAGAASAPGVPGEPTVVDDSAAEAEADRVADAAVARLGPDPSDPPVRNGALAPSLQTALASVAPDAARPGTVRFHTDEEAARAADQLGARAFIAGRDVAVARGELDHPREGARLAAHEAVHAARHQPKAGRGFVHAKLRGTREALESTGGGKTTTRFARKTNWDKILDGVAAYEWMEAVLLKSGNPTPTELAAVKPRFLAQLAKIEKACLAWQKANVDKAEKKRSARWEQEFEETKMLDLLEDDPRTKTAKARKEDKGQMNVVKELHYKTESGEFSGYFKEEKGFAKQIQGHEARVGIRQLDPNYGARAVAMYRIDKLLGADVTARAEFATHGGKMGTVLESAKGIRGADVKFALTDEQRAELGPDSVSVDDPAFQRGMSKLQVLDAICGQLDRHQGNWFVDVDPKTGKVKGVTGIDLDMAFGAKMKSEDPGKVGAHNYLGLPAQIDREFGLAILKIPASDIRNAISGLLSDAEVDATVKRFVSVKKKIRKLEKEGRLVGTWDQTTAQSNRAKTYAGATTYGGQASAVALKETIERVREAVKRALETGEGLKPDRWRYLGSPRKPEDAPRGVASMHGAPAYTLEAIRQSLNYLVYSKVKDGVEGGTIPPQSAPTIAVELLNEMLGDDYLMAQCEVAVMEFDQPGMAATIAVEPILAKFLLQRLAALTGKGQAPQKVGAKV